MLNRLAGFFFRIANWKTFLIAVVIYSFFGFYLMPHGLKTISKLSGKNVEILDLQFTGYSVEKAKAILDNYTNFARDYSCNFTAVADSLYPIAYTLLYMVTIAWIFKAQNRTQGAYRYLLLVPFIAMIFDYCENTYIIKVVGSYPNLNAHTVGIASHFTVLKWCGAGLETLVVLTGLVLLIIYRLRPKG